MLVFLKVDGYLFLNCYKNPARCPVDQPDGVKAMIPSGFPCASGLDDKQIRSLKQAGYIQWASRVLRFGFYRRLTTR